MKHKLMILVILCLAVAAAVIFFMLGRQEAVSGYTLAEQPFIQTVQGTGRIRADRKAEITAQVNETLERIMVSEGQTVKAGDFLAEFDVQRQILALEQFRISVQTALNRLASIKGTELETAQSLLRQSLLKQEEHQRQMERSQQLFEAGALSAADMETLQLQKKLLDEAVLTAQGSVAAKRPVGNEYEAALLGVEQAKAQLEQRQADQENYTIPAPFDGVILKIQGIEGKRLSIGDDLLTIADPASYRIRMDVDERYMGLLKKGQKASFWLGEDAGQRYQGTVESVALQVDSQTGTIEVKISMDSMASWLAEDLTLQTEIVVREASQGLLVPQDYLYKEAPFEVLVLQDGKVQAVAFEGVRIDQGKILVIQGLEKGSVLLNPAQNLKIGQEIARIQYEGGADHAF
jgi:RND family efflux transporter MFP subunit